MKYRFLLFLFLLMLVVISAIVLSRAEDPVGAETEWTSYFDTH